VATAQHCGQSSDPTEHVQCRIAANRCERESAFRLLHDSYTRSGLIQPNPHGMRVTPHHLLRSTEVFVAVLREEVICTFSLVGDSDLGVPMEAIYPELIADRRTAGLRFAEVSALADRRGDVQRFFPVFLKLIQVMLPYALHQGMQQVLIAVHPRHARIYQRFFKLEPVGEVREYPQVRNHPAVALCLDFAKLEKTNLQVYRNLFCQPIPPGALNPSPMSTDERTLLGPIASYYDAPQQVAPWSDDAEHAISDYDACAA
jgi:N-acyl amino acid synthase FeeM